MKSAEIQVVVTKPVARWQIWLGKWLGIVTLNAVLLAISGACVFGLLQWRASKLPPAVQKVLRDEVLVARGSAKEAKDAVDVEAATDRTLEEQIKSKHVDQADIPELRKQIRESVLAYAQLVPPSCQRTWKN